MTRRDFVAKLAAAGAAIGAICASRGAIIVGGEAPKAQSVISFHMDRPYIDPTGTAKPYLPPQGARSGEPAAHWDEATYRRVCCYG